MTTLLATVGSIKVKLGVLVAASCVVAAVVGVLGAAADVPVLLALPITVLLALGVTQLLAVGMTSPLREMTEAARRMARGDYRGRVRAESSDEVGELARAFNQMAAELAAVDREQRELVATVSHELRTPLAGLTAVLENLADGVVPADEEHLEAAIGQARRVTALVGDLLELSRVDAGITRLELVPLSVADLVDATVAEVAPTARTVTFDVDVEPGLEVEADRARLRQLLVNLLDNACRHAPAGTSVRVTAWAYGERWRLEVSDHGPGVAPADRERAFERFGTLATDPATSQPGGTGLGLAIARWVATLHGGSVRFVDPPAGAPGAVVRAELPLHPPSKPAATPPPAATAGPIDEEVVSTMSAAVPPAPTSPPAPPAAGTTAVDVPPIIDTMFGRHWPDVPGSGLGVVVAAAMVGTLGAVLLPERQHGLALFVVLLAAGGTVWWSARHRTDRFTVLCMVLGALCALPVLLLDAEWIAVLCVLAGAAVMVVGVTRGRRLPEFGYAGIAWPLSSIRGLPWLGRSLRRVTGSGRGPSVVVTVLWSLLGVLVFGLLFASADAIVADWADAVLPDVTLDSFVQRAFVACAIGGATLTAAYLALNPPDVSAVPGGTARPAAHRYEWLVPVLLVDAVVAVFVVAQVTVLFGGHGYVQDTTGLTYAEYSHQGFGQLTVATLLTLVVVWAASRRVGTDRSDRLWMQTSLGLLCGLTLVVVVSALHRMQLYQEEYGFTQLRLLVDVFEGWLGLVVIAVMVAGLVRWRVWLPRFALVSGVVALLGIAAINPDAWIAEQNIERYASTERLDVEYLWSLSDDAVPVLLDLPEPLRSCALIGGRDLSDEDWLAWNLGRARARDAAGADAIPAPRAVSCSSELGSD